MIQEKLLRNVLSFFLDILTVVKSANIHIQRFDNAAGKLKGAIHNAPFTAFKSPKEDLYAIVDGFHRWRVMKEHADIYEREKGMLPVTVIDKPLSNRMASTIRHNRARGSHDVGLMSNIIKELHELGRSDAWISKHLGMDKDEILRLKQITGLAALFRDIKFGQAWKPIEVEEEQLISEEQDESIPPEDGLEDT